QDLAKVQVAMYAALDRADRHHGRRRYSRLDGPAALQETSCKLGPLTLQLGHQALERLICAFGEASRLLGDSLDIVVRQRFLGECRIVGRNGERDMHLGDPARNRAYVMEL